METSAGHKSGALSTHLALVTKKVGCLVGEEPGRDFVEVMGGNTGDVRWSQIRGAVHSCVSLCVHVPMYCSVHASMYPYVAVL